MEVSIASTGEKYEELTADQAFNRWTKASDRQFAVFQLWNETEIDSEDWSVLSKAMAIATQRTEEAAQAYEKAKARQGFEALLADAMERGEREAFDAHYANEPLPCEVDEVEPDPLVEDAAVTRQAEQADASAFEQESRI